MSAADPVTAPATPVATNGHRQKVTKPARFPRVLSVAVPQYIADSLEQAAANGLLTVSDYARIYIDAGLRNSGQLKPGDQNNG